MCWLGLGVLQNATVAGLAASPEVCDGSAQPWKSACQVSSWIWVTVRSSTCSQVKCLPWFVVVVAKCN